MPLLFTRNAIRKYNTVFFPNTMLHRMCNDYNPTVVIMSTVQYLLRDILQFDKTLDEAMDRISNAHRTCYLILGVGDWKVGEVVYLNNAEKYQYY